MALLKCPDILPKSQDGDQVGCIWECHEAQGIAINHHDSILADSMGYWKWALCRQSAVAAPLPS
jgi:hypothetical protein